MELFNPVLMYEFHAKELGQVDAVKQYADHTVAAIKSIVGWDADVQINIEPQAKDKHLYSVSMAISGLNDPIFAKKEGKHVLAVLRKVRKSVLSQLRRRNERILRLRRKQFFKKQLAS